MKIISKFKDYYDGGAMYGIDTERVYVRTTEVIEEHGLSKSNDFKIIGFCGELFLFVDWTTVSNCDPKQYILWGEDTLKYEFTSTYTPYIGEILKKKKKKETYRRWLKEAYDKLKNNKEVLALFLKYKTPIFFLGYSNQKYTLILNPKLKDYNFAKNYGTVEAFQKIEQFISNELVEDKQGDTPVGGNEVLGRSKGFDEYSFRNAKKKPKKF